MKNKLLLLTAFTYAVFFVSCNNDDEIEKPVVSANPPAQAITSGSSTSIALSSSITGTTFTWTVAQTNVTGAAGGSGATIAQTLTVTGTVAGTVVYTVTPVAAGVVGNPITVTVTVNLKKVTYTADVKPVLTTSCAPCHLAGGTNSNKFDDYSTTKNKIATILDRVKREPGATGFMPKNGTKLPADKIALLEKWQADGLLEN
jgi:hypothetical protein